MGSSENLDDSHGLFAPLDKRYRLFVRRTLPRSSVPSPALNLASVPGSIRGNPAQRRRSVRSGSPQPLSEPSPGERRGQLFGDLHLALLERFAPPSVVVNSSYDIVHLTQHAGEFLQMAGGEISTNVLKMVHPALRLELRTALFRAGKNNQEVSVPRVPLQWNGVPRLLNLHVRPARTGEENEGFTLIVFDLLPEAGEAVPALTPASEPIAQHLEEEVQHLREQLGSSVEQYEASVEELKASNEELQAINEELRSTAEELETSKEELQSVNEELTTVNHELKSKVEELSHSNSDLQNLMASTEIGTIFLDRQLHIKRFTPSTQQLFNLIPTDEGRPLSDLTHKLHYPSLAEDAERVLRELHSHEREVGSGGRWFLARILPYRTLEDRIDGVVLTCVDITARKQVEEALRASEERYRLAVEGALDYAITLYDAAGRCTGWSRGAERIFGYQEAEALGQTSDFVFTPEDRAAGMPDMERETARREGRVEDERWHMRKDGSRFFASGVMTPLWESEGIVRGYVKVSRDLTRQRQMEVALRVSEEQYRLTVENIHDYAIFTLDTQGHITSWNEGAKRVKEYEAHEVLGRHLRLFYMPEDQQRGRPEREMEHAAATGRNEDESWRVRKDGTRFWADEIMTAMHDDAGILRGFVKITRDLTERRQAEEEHLAFERETTLLNERNRMAQELHDTLAQGFTGIKMQLELAQLLLQETPPEVEEGMQRLMRAKDIALESHLEARRSIRALRSPLRENVSLAQAFERLAQEANDRVQVSFTVDGTPYALSALPENDIYRIGQEALTNALRHSGAERVVLTLTYFEDQVHLCVRDEGRGFDPQTGRAGFGTMGMQERARRLGADLQITSRPGQGTQVTLMMPVPPGQIPATA